MKNFQDVNVYDLFTTSVRRGCDKTNHKCDNFHTWDVKVDMYVKIKTIFLSIYFLIFNKCLN